MLSVELGDGNVRTSGLKRGCPKKDGKIINKNKFNGQFYPNSIIYK